MIGTIINVAGILIGGAAGFAKRKPLAPATEHWLKLAVAVFTVFYGLRLMWISLNGSFLQILKQLLILILALMLGRLTGRLLRLQKFSNRLGRQARERLMAAQSGQPPKPGDGFKTCAALFCAAPLGILGAIQDGLSLSQYFYPLAVKAVIDGLATLSFISLFGWTVILAALPVLVFQGTLSLVCAHLLEPLLDAHGLLDPVNATSGLLLACIGLGLLDLAKIKIADYLPSLIFAPLITWLWR